MRTVSFQIPDKFCGRDFWRKGNGKVHMVVRPTDGVNKSTHFLRLCSNGILQLRLMGGIK